MGPTLRSDALREAWKERFGPVEVKDAKRSKVKGTCRTIKCINGAHIAMNESETTVSYMDVQGNLRSTAGIFISGFWV